MIRLAAFASAIFLLAVQPGIAGTQGRQIDALKGDPVVYSISRVDAKQYQTIVIRGRNFGDSQPYDGDSSYLWMVDVQGNGTGWWRAGCPERYGPCGTYLSVSSWTDSAIVISGFTNGIWPTKGDLVNFFIWNPQTGRGPAAAARMVE